MLVTGLWAYTALVWTSDVSGKVTKILLSPPPTCTTSSRVG